VNRLVPVRRSAFARPVIALGLGGVLLLSSCSSDATSSPTTAAGLVAQTINVVGSDAPESQVLAEIYAEALENAGLRVGRKDPLAGREQYYSALQSDEIQLVAEYTNSLLGYVLASKDPKATPDAKTTADQVTAIKAALPATLTIGDPSTAQNNDVIVCSQAVVEQYSLKTLSDLAKVADKVTLGAPAAFETRAPFGLVGFKDTYKAEFKKFVPLDFGLVADSLKRGEIDCGDMLATMPAIAIDGLVPLQDDKAIGPDDAVVPLLTTAAATPEVLAALKTVSDKLTTDVLRALMVKVEVDKLTPDEVAKQFMATVSTGQ
jgi:osmoprotectant transport system substrate-binding protein